MNESGYWPLMIPSRGMKRPQGVDKIEANSFSRFPQRFGEVTDRAIPT